MRTNWDRRVWRFCRSTALEVSTLLFMSQGLLTIMAALVALIWVPRLGGNAKLAESGGIVLSPRVDSGFFGQSIPDILAANPLLAPILDRILKVEIGLWLAFGLFQTMVAWFALRQKQAWAFWAVVLADAASLTGWWQLAAEYVARGIRLGLDLPPVVFLYASAVLPVASLLGWLGLRKREVECD